MRTIEQIVGQDIDTHVGKITEELSELGISREELATLDHLCYRVETDERYEIMKEELQAVANLCGESEVGGRLISIFELHDYIESRGWTIPYMELPAPKQGSDYPEGLEHAEFEVVGNLDKFRQRHADVDFEYKNRGINPELVCKTGRVALKFHRLQIGEVVRIEQYIAAPQTGANS